MQVYLQNPPTIRIGGQVSKSLYQYSMQSPDKHALYAAARKLETALADVPGLEDLTSDLEVTSPQVNVDIDRDKAAALGVTASQIENAFYDAYGPRWVSTIYAPVNEYKVLLELAPQFQADPSALSLLYFKAAPAARSCRSTRWPRARSRSARRRSTTTASCPSVTMSFGLAPGASLGDVLEPRAATSPTRRCPRASPASSRARRRRSRARCRTSPSCSSSPCWSSTSCSAFSTRATSTR